MATTSSNPPPPNETDRLISAVAKANANSRSGGAYGGGDIQIRNSEQDASVNSSTGTGEEEDDDDEHKTTVMQTFIHLVKGYLGAGCLSLPWAVSQLGIGGAVVAIFVMAFWSSYNCWTIVKLKRHMERATFITGQGTLGGNSVLGDGIDNKSDIAGSAIMSDRASSVATSASHITYPDVGEYLYGTSFQSYIRACICTQQLAICTVFFSFIGENLLAVLQRLPAGYFPAPLCTHVGVITMAVPPIMALSFIPSIKALTPALIGGSITLLMGFAVLGLLVGEEWHDRPPHTPTLDPAQAPLALCAILYSYEGINLILPIENEMKEPKHFKRVFWQSMAIVAGILATVSTLCVVAFGKVTNGSITAFLLEAYRDDPSITWWLMIANTAVSVSVLLTYPLQLFPALELMAPWMSRLMTSPSSEKSEKSSDDDNLSRNDDEHDLTGFDPLPSLPEHNRVEHPLVDMEHNYEDDTAGEASLTKENVNGGGGGGEINNNETENKPSSTIDSRNDDDNDIDIDDEVKSTMSSVTQFPKITFNMTVGDSLQIRAILVLMTYLVAVVVPNVQALISLAGALAGSSTALLIPPLLELAWINKHAEKKQERQQQQPPSFLKSPTINRRELLEMENSITAATAAAAADTTAPAPPRRISKRWWRAKVKCYVLLGLGFVFFGIGTYASVADIVRIYHGGS